MAISRKSSGNLSRLFAFTIERSMVWKKRDEKRSLAPYDFFSVE